jgi:hypothetical protein
MGNYAFDVPRNVGDLSLIPVVGLLFTMKAVGAVYPNSGQANGD